MRRLLGRPGTRGGGCDDILDIVKTDGLRDAYALWSKVLFHFECSHGYWVGCRLFPSRQLLLSPVAASPLSRGCDCGVTHPSSAGVIASTLRPNICQYHAVDPIAKTVAPMGRALFFREDAAPSAEELDVEAARYIIQFVSHDIN